MNYEAEKVVRFLIHHSTSAFTLRAAAKQKDQKQNWKRYSEQPEQNVTGRACGFYFIR